jgi:hypothetical protein
MKSDIWIFSKIYREVQVTLKSGKNEEYFIWKRFHVYGNISLISP